MRREIQSGWPRRSRLGTSRLLGRSRRADVWRRVVPVISFDDALVLCAFLTRLGRHGEAAWRGQDDTGRTRAAFRAGGRQVAFRHRSQLRERPALLAHIFVRRHRTPHPGKTHPAADQSVAIMETIPVDSSVVNIIGHFLARVGIWPRRAARKIVARMQRSDIRGCRAEDRMSFQHSRTARPSRKQARYGV